MKYVPPSFDQARVIEGLHKAMGFGEPNVVGDKTTFWTETATASAGAKDQEDVPFDPSVRRPTTKSSKQVTCALEYNEKSTVVNDYGVSQPSSVTITLLDEDYQQIKGFSWVVAGGNQYFYSETEPPTGMGSIDVWTVHANSRDQR